MSRRGTRFRETMLGTVRFDGESFSRQVRLDLSVSASEMLRPAGTTVAKATGRVRVQGRADDTTASGTLEISPLRRRRIRYRLTFHAAGQSLELSGWKSIKLLRPVRSITVLPFTLYAKGTPIASGTLRFPLATGLLAFLGSFRFPRKVLNAASPVELAAGHGPETSRSSGTVSGAQASPRWSGQPGRTEVWYTTATDPATGTGMWLHHELVAPANGSAPFAHGWVAVFPPDRPVEHARFGPEPWLGCTDGFEMERVSARGGQLVGSAGGFSWNLLERSQDEPLFTFPRWAWRHALLPAAQMLPAARALYDGTLTHNGKTLTLKGAPGASARIYGHGNAQAWAWLHADLGGGDILEIVAAVSTRPVLRSLPPLVFLRLRSQGRTWPRRAERTAVGWAGLGRFRASIGTSEWTVSGRVGLRRIRVEVFLPPERTLALEYTDPDGTSAVCRNSESADAIVRIERWWGAWRLESSWQLRGTAHAEVGTR
ncbi:hypothetical protein ACFWB2_40750 [Streptomyces virginiae]|uniref:hypothetical protein n=1 Tax=Streptomyces virginiae TaxID=1961 RepID=UPI003690328F